MTPIVWIQSNQKSAKLSKQLVYILYQNVFPGSCRFQSITANTFNFSDLVPREGAQFADVISSKYCFEIVTNHCILPLFRVYVFGRTICASAASFETLSHKFFQQLHLSRKEGPISRQRVVSFTSVVPVIRPVPYTGICLSLGDLFRYISMDIRRYMV